MKHWDFSGAVQAITFRLADSVPLELIRQWKRELGDMADDKAGHRELHRLISRYEDWGTGSPVNAPNAD